MIWGNERVFTNGDSVVHAVPRLDGDTVIEVVVTSMEGNDCDRLTAWIRDIYKGTLYSTWETGRIG